MPKFIDILTTDEKRKINALFADGTLNELNMQNFVDRFIRAPDRSTAFEHARDGTLGARLHREIVGIDKAFKDPGIGIRAAEQYFKEKGAVRGAAELAWSAVTTPVRAYGGVLSGEGFGERPLERMLGLASVIPVARAGTALTSAGFKGAARAAAGAGQASRAATLTGTAKRLSDITRSPLWAGTSIGLEVGDVVVGAEEWPLELAAEGMLEGAARLGQLTSGRGKRIIEGLDPQAAEDAQTTESTAEHDDLTGSRTAPGTQGLSPEAARAAERAAADSAVESADAQTALDTATQQRQESLDQQLRREAWERILIESEEQEAAAAEQARIEQSFIDQDDAYTQQQAAEAEAATEQQAAEAEAATEQQAAEAEKIEFTKTWLPFYSDLAGGSQSEGIRLLNAEYEAGVRDPIAHRYDQIAAGLQPQMGVAPSELHREADRQLRQTVGEKWYNVYRGIDERPTPQQRAQRAAEAADKIVEGTDDTTSGTDDAASPAALDKTDGPENEPETPETAQETETIPQAQVGTETVGYESDGVTAHNVRPVLRNLDEIIPSHDLSGNEREDFPQKLQPRKTRGGQISMGLARTRAQTPNFAWMLEFFKHFRDGPPLTSKQHPRRVVSGNGRTLTLQIMRNEYPENWERFQQALRAELEKIGIDPAEADAMQAAGESPVLTYELLDDTDEVELAKDSNQKSTQEQTATEQASEDTTYFDDDLMALWQPGEGSFEDALKSEENQAFRTALFQQIPTHLVSAFMTEDNRSFSNDGIKRIQNAMIEYVFGEDIGDQLANVLIEQGLEDVKNIETMLRNSIASLAYAKANAQDISTDLASAIFRFIEINRNAERDAQQRKQPKDVMLYAGIEAFYRSGALIEAPTLLEKQLLYLIYAKRNAPRQLADDFQIWAQNAVSRAQASQGGMFSDPTISEAIFAGIIRDYIRETIFATRVTPEGQTALVPPDSLPPELVNLRESMDAMSDAADKERFANDWIDAFLRMMNEGETQNETDTDRDTADEERTRYDTGTPRGTGEDRPQGTPDRDVTGTSRTPESDSGGVAPTQPRGTDSDESGAAQGAAGDLPADDRGSDLGILANRINPDRYPGASARQLFTLAVVEHLRFTDQPLTEAQLLAGYSKAVGFDVAQAFGNEGHITDMHQYIDEAIEETLEKRDVQEKGITREMLEARLPTQRQTTDTDTTEAAMSVEEALDIASVGTMDMDAWNAADPDRKRTFLQRQEQAIPIHLQTGAITEEQAEHKREAIAHLRRNIEQQETSPGRETTPTETPVDTNQVVGVSRRIETPETTVSPVLQRDLDTLGITIDEWEQMKADGEAIDFINSLTEAQQEQVEWGVNLIADMERSADAAAIATADAEADADIDEDTDFDDDFFSDVETGILKDITDEQRSDFDIIRRKKFLAQTIGRLEAKGRNRNTVETALLRALTAPQRTDAQQEIYHRELQKFIDRTVAQLQAKTRRSAGDNRALDALQAVQAEGIPEEASELSLYADLETPDQEHSRPLSETRTLSGVQAPATADTQLNLPETVTADKTKLSPAQQTSVKAIISAFGRKIHTDTDTTVQGGFLLGDKPGVGKTRQALATLWHYMRSGINKHFILAPNQQLLNNYSADMQAMGGPVGDISNYHSGNQKVSTPIGTVTYDTVTRKPDLTHFTTTGGNQNAVADIVEHLTGARPTLSITHPEHYTNTLEAYRRILSNVETPTVENVIAELREQARRVNLNNAANVESFRQRLTPLLADLLLAERDDTTGQKEMFQGSELQERVKQLLDFGRTHLMPQPDPDFNAKASLFEGVIVLDEMHKAAGTDSQIGQTIAKIHALLPNAKFLYMSATPFKEIDNFWVADRLGLWGANQPFPTFSHFRRAFRRAARAVKEVVPLHLKQIGRYLSRALSAKETRYTPVEIPLSDTEKAQYDTAVTFVRTLRSAYEASIDAALRTPWGSQLELEGVDGKYRGHYMKMFYGGMQKFFLAVLDAMKAQGLQADIKAKLQNGDKIIVQLENTWEKTAEHARARGQSSVGPFDLLIDFVENENLFPVHQFTTEIRRRNDGTEYTAITPVSVFDDTGKQGRAIDPTLKQRQTAFLEMLRSQMQKQADTLGLPFAADIIHAIAADAGVASGEISGRPEIYINGTPQQMPQSPDNKIARAKTFSETTDLNLIVLGPSGLTGINLPVADSIKDEVGALYHYLLQSSWNVNTFEQGLGRGKRSNSAIDPHYMIAHQDLPGGDRVLGATLAKFAEMGALAGQADNALMQNIDKVEGETSLDDDPEASDVFQEQEEQQQKGERPHIFGVHGHEALGQLWKDIYDTGAFELVDTLGLTRPEIAGDTGLIDPDTLPSVQQFFQRLLHQSTADQPRFYQQFEERLKRIITYKKELGELDVGANDLNSKDGQIRDRLTIYTDPDTGQTADVVRLSVKRQLPRRSWEFAQKVIRGEDGYEHHGRDFQGIYADADGHVWAVFEAPVREGGGQETEYIRWGPRGTPVQGLHQGEHRITAEQLDSDFTAVSLQTERRLLDIDEAKRLWEAEDSSADAYVDSEIFMATGLILPKWKDLSTPNYRHATMAVIPMLDGSNLHGRVIPSSVISEILTQIGGVDPDYFDPTRTPEERAAAAEASPNGEGSDVDIPAIVRDIIGQQTDTRIAARLEQIVEHIHKKLPLRLRGHRVRDAAEAALLGQLIRDPQVEHTWIVYRKNDQIVKIEPISLSRKGETEAGDFAHIKRMAAKEGADSILRIHNHPSGVAKWSDADKRAAMQWHKELGTLMAEDIIVDSGTYAYRTFKNGEYTWHEDTVLDPNTVEWETGAQTATDTSGEQKPTDVLYQNPLIRGAREAATYMMGIKRRTEDVAELIFVDSRTGKITDAWTDTTLRGAGTDPVQYLKDAFTVRQGQQVHIALWGDDAAVSLARSLQGIDGVDSVWVNSQRITGMEHIGQQAQETITMDIGGQNTQIDQSFLRDYTAQVQRTNPDSAVYRVHAPEDLAMEGRGRAKTAEVGEKALNTFMDSNAGIMKVLKAWSPMARRWARMTKNEFVSGFGRLTELEAPEGSDAPSPADVLKEILRERQHISKLNAGRALSSLEPHLLAFNKLARKRTSLRTEAVAPKTRQSKRGKLSEKVWNFIEYNTPIEKDKELLALAEGLKEAWREMLIHDTQKIVELMEELEKINETLYVTDAAGKRTEWYGESFDGFQWDAETKAYTKEGKAYTVEEAHRAANRLYMPHYFRGKSPLQQYSALQKMQDDLNRLLAAGDPAAEKELLQRFEIEIDAQGFLYTHLPTGKTATTAYEMVRIVANHVANEDAALQGIVNYYEDEGRVGYYGHLERTRETDDRFYTRDISLLAENRIRLWDRLAEVATIGQQHPLIGDSPRMQTLIEQVMNFDKTPREAALRKVIEALNSGQEGMFERMPQFASGVNTALDIMLHWLERDADGEKTGRYQEIDIQRMNLDDATLTELERIGLIEQSNGNWKVVGEDIDQRHATMARHIHEFYNTLAQRKNAVHSVVLGLGNWHTRDPLEMESAEFWKKINDTITVMTLNHGVAIQNLLEIPLISMLTGANPLFKGLKNMSNKEYRGQMQQLARGLSHARKFMADTTLADKYLGSRWTFFSKSDEFSRAAGLGIGLENAKGKIQQYAEAEGKKRAAIGRDMDAVRLNKDVIGSIPADQLAQTLEAAEELILNNEVETVFSSEQGGELTPAERLAGTMLRSMFYVSDEAFKAYDATSLPKFMMSRNPLIRVFMKYKSWMLQQNRLVYNQLRRAYRETKKGNLQPLADFVAATAMMGLGTGGLLWAYSLLQGDDDDKAWQERLFKGLAAAQAFGISSVMFELAMYAEGNWYQMSNLLAKQAAGPTFSVAAQMVGPVLTGDFGRAGEEALRRLPIVSFSRRVGGWRLLEEATGNTEEE